VSLEINTTCEHFPYFLRTNNGQNAIKTVLGY